MNVVERIKKYGKNTERMRNAFGYNEGVRNAWTPIWCRNAARNYSAIEKIFATRNADMSGLKEIYKPAPTIILGSGPSQHDIRPYLKDWKGNLFISTSQLPLCAYLGIKPTVLLLIDADPAMIYLVKEYAQEEVFKDTLFVTHPQVPREYIEAWAPEKIFFFRMFDPGDTFSAQYLPLMYGWMNEQTQWCIRSTILNGGNVVNSAIPLASELNNQEGKVHPIFLAGYDLGYPDNLMRCSDYKKLPDGSWEEIPARPLTEQRWKDAVRVESNNGVPFDELGQFYKTSSIILWGMSAPPVISCSRGVMTEWPYVHPECVVKSQGEGFNHLIVDAKTAYRASQAYLQPRGFLNIKTDFWMSVKNLGTEKKWKKFLITLEHNWFNSRPWKWLGGNGWVPLKIHRIRWKEKMKKRIEERGKKEVKSV